MNITNNVYTDIKWFEDFEIGQEFEYGAWKMKLDDMLAFARTYDPEPFHLDEVAAKTAGWRGIIASGLQISSIWRRMGKDAFPNSQTVISPGWDKIRWLIPVFEGDILSAVTKISATRVLKSRADQGVVVLDNKILNQRGEVVSRLSSTWFVRRKCTPSKHA